MHDVSWSDDWVLICRVRKRGRNPFYCSLINVVWVTVFIMLILECSKMNNLWMHVSGFQSCTSFEMFMVTMNYWFLKFDKKFFRHLLPELNSSVLFLVNIYPHMPRDEGFVERCGVNRILLNFNFFFKINFFNIFTLFWCTDIKNNFFLKKIF
jgi:hypothetical protein